MAENTIEQWDGIDYVIEGDALVEYSGPTAYDVESCNCEHTNHFNDEFGPQTKHDHQAVAAGSKSALYVGAICDDCAETCMVDYVSDDYREEPAAYDVRKSAGY